MISSPGRNVAAIERLIWNVSDVMFAPNLISLASAPRRSAIAACAAWSIASERWLVANGPPWFAFDVR